MVLVVGGSQGARAINDTVAAWVQRGLPPGLGLIWATGRQQAAAYAEHEGPLVRVRPYLAPISEAYAAADMAVSRAGAMSIAELCAWGIPPVLVPLPTAAQDHQAHNARATAVAGAAIHLPQSELSAEQLDRAVRELRDDPARMQSMQEAAARRARPDAADAIARDLLRLIGRTA